MTRLTANIVIKILLYVLLSFFLISTPPVNALDSEITQKQYKSDINDMKTSLEAVSKLSILFGHNSVGSNMLDGIISLSEEYDQTLNIKLATDIEQLEQKTFVHFKIGQNRFPETKVDSFIRTVNDLSKETTPDIIIMKFCYVDLIPESDIDVVFAYYEKKTNELKLSYPDTKLLHMTVPLTTNAVSFKSMAKKLVGMMTWEQQANIKRDQFNKMLISTYPSEAIFDLAKIESTHPDGTDEAFKVKNKVYRSMVPDYTDDGGHLNDLGKEVVASQFIKFLATTGSGNKEAR